jgi:hypothetical protein
MKPILPSLAHTVILLSAHIYSRTLTHTHNSYLWHIKIFIDVVPPHIEHADANSMAMMASGASDGRQSDSRNNNRE